jgi:hypothetical protein
VRQEIHDQVLTGTINTKESALETVLSAAAKKICSAAVNSREWSKDGWFFLLIINCIVSNILWIY